MPSPSSFPTLRAVETIVVPDARYGKVLLLRDTQGVTDSHAAIPPALVPIVARFTGEQSCEEIAKAVAASTKADVPVDVVVRLAKQLDDALFLQGPTFERAKRRIADDFAASAVRAASHAGGAYSANAEELRRYLDDKCLAHAQPAAPQGDLRESGALERRMVGLIAPHIDPWRGAVGYGHAYGALARSISADVDTFVLFGTSHAPMREAFALCDKAFDTPLGAVEADHDAMATLARRAPFDAYADQLNHKKEHSLEFQVVFLRHLLKGRKFRIVPVLAGLGEHQANGTSPERDDRANRFLDGVREVIAARPGRVVVVAGADLAHVGPRFGDAAALEEGGRRTLEQNDRGSLEYAAGGDASGFWTDVARDLTTRRVCGLAPIYSLLRTLPGKSTAELLHYEQNVDSDDGSIVSHAAMGFFA